MSGIPTMPRKPIALYYCILSYQDQNRRLLAELFEVENVHVGLPLRRTSNQGQTDVLADVWGSDALLAYINPRPALKQISLSYMFQSRPRQVFKYRDDTISSDVIRCSEVTDEKMVANGAGYLWKNVLG